MATPRRLCPTMSHPQPPAQLLAPVVHASTCLPLPVLHLSHPALPCLLLQPDVPRLPPLLARVPSQQDYRPHRQASAPLRPSMAGPAPLSELAPAFHLTDSTKPELMSPAIPILFQYARHGYELAMAASTSAAVAPRLWPRQARASRRQARSFRPPCLSDRQYHAQINRLSRSHPRLPHRVDQRLQCHIGICFRRSDRKTSSNPPPEYLSTDHLHPTKCRHRLHHQQPPLRNRRVQPSHITTLETPNPLCLVVKRPWQSRTEI